ncbi:hypothetical protein [Exiguobacterium sp. SL-10]|uniref:hypothetical protein n=1 Tax=Exiguobacterium sp. SL-10 TaxID=2510962 RepID=UPI0013763900|nr:hypothetical protein [Exiguobacterium sp. SL-10]
MLTQIGQDIIASLSKPIAIESGTTGVGASIGASLWQTEMVPHTAIERETSNHAR